MSQSCVVIPLYKAVRDELYLSREAVRWAFDDLAESLGVAVRPRHRELFVKRRYRSVADIKKALTRYKVFGDLGYGA